VYIPGYPDYSYKLTPIIFKQNLDSSKIDYKIILPGEYLTLPTSEISYSFEIPDSEVMINTKYILNTRIWRFVRFLKPSYVTYPLAVEKLALVECINVDISIDNDKPVMYFRGNRILLWRPIVCSLVSAKLIGEQKLLFAM